MVLLAAFQTVLSRWSAQSDVSVGTPIAGRNHLEIEGLIGFFVNTLVLRGELAGDPAFGALLSRVRETSLEAHTHQEVPFEKLVEELAPERSLGHSPLFQVMFALQNTASEELPEVSGLALAPWGGGDGSGIAKFDLTLAFAEVDGGLEGALEYSTDLFDGATVDRLAGHCAALLAAAVRDPGRAALGAAAAGRGRALAARWRVERHRGRKMAAESCRPRAVHRGRRGGPRRRWRCVCEGEELEYGELERRANALARRLRALGVGPEVAGGLCMERSAWIWWWRCWRCSRRGGVRAARSGVPARSGWATCWRTPAPVLVMPPERSPPGCRRTALPVLVLVDAEREGGGDGPRAPVDSAPTRWPM